MREARGVIGYSLLVMLVSFGPLLLGLLLVIGLAVQAQQHTHLEANVQLILSWFTGLMLTVGIWGSVSAIGCMLRNNFARRSAIAFGLCLAGVSLLGALLCCGFLAGHRFNPAATVLSLIYFLIQAGCASAWVWYFHKTTVRTQFGVPTTEPSEDGVPFGVRVIGWLMIVTSLFAVYSLWRHVPQTFLTVLLTGKLATADVIVLASAELIIGVGLLRRVRWAWYAAMCYYAFVLLDCSIATFDMRLARALHDASLSSHGAQGGVSFSPVEHMVLTGGSVILLDLIPTLVLWRRRAWLLASTPSEASPW